MITRDKTVHRKLIQASLHEEIIFVHVVQI